MDRQIIVRPLAVIAASDREDVVCAAALGFGTGVATTGDNETDTFYFDQGPGYFLIHDYSYLHALDGYSRIVSNSNSRVVGQQLGAVNMRSHPSAECEVVTENDETAFMRGMTVPTAGGRLMIAAANSGDCGMKGNTVAEVCAHADGTAYMRMNDLGSRTEEQVSRR